MNSIYMFIFKRFNIVKAHMINTLILGGFIYALYKWMTYDLTTVKGGIAAGLITGYLAARWSERYLELLKKVKEEQKND